MILSSEGVGGDEEGKRGEKSGKLECMRAIFLTVYIRSSWCRKTA